MPHTQKTLEEKKLCCIACGKIIGEGYMVQGKIIIDCKHCGVENIIEAKIRTEGQHNRRNVKVIVNSGYTSALNRDVVTRASVL